ncbi:MAG TPA: ATP-binding protein [Steroidobacteraceae bacterium]|jgi:signal transduction histidine kinase|nr:ATP-binding protein [Steroidobacteraceae bacterium]
MRALLPDTVFGRLLLIVLASVVVPDAIALFLAPAQHRASLLGALFLLLPPLAIGVYFAARSITRPLAQLTREAEALGHGTEGEATEATGPRELRALSNAFETAQTRVRTYVSHRSRALAAVSHDLKAPLTRMQLRVETLTDDVAREKLERDIEELSSMVRSAIAMLRDLEAAESVESIDVNALLARLQSEYAEMGRSVAVTGRARRPYLGRMQLLRRCLTNLIDNAVKFGESASVTLEDGHALRVKVADRGPGIAPDEIEKVFQPFYRAHAALARGVEGTGLGLSIARDIVLGHGGELRLRNRDVRGLEAEVVLPRS